MFNPLLPASIDNTYRGQKLALWLFGLLLFVKLAMSVNSILNGSRILTSADGVPLDTYPPAAARTIVSLFALLALSHLVVVLLGVLALVRYRAMVPLVFTLFLVEQLAKKPVLRFLPIERTGAPPASAINLGLLALMIVGLALSLWRRRDRVEVSTAVSR